MASPENDENAAGPNGNELDEFEEEQTGVISEQENSEGPEEEKFSGDELDDTETEPSADRDENQAELSGNELDELEEEQTGTISGQENSKDLEEEQLSGDKLDDLDDTEAEPIPEPAENEAERNGNELEELEEEQTGAISEQENSEGLEEGQFSGDELDESDDTETKPIPEEKKAHQSDTRGSGKKGLWLVSAIGLCVLIGIGYLYLKEEKSKGLPGQNSETVPVAVVSVPGEQLLLFDSFIIPIPENREFTYISLSISFKLPNKQIKRLMTEKKKELRGIIYDILAEEISKRKEVPPLESLKKLIIGGVNSALSTGEVHKVYVTKFLAV